MEDVPMDEGAVALETPTPDIFVPPSVHRAPTLAGESYTHFSPVPPSLQPSSSSSSQPASAGVPCVLGVDEAGRGPVLGPMVYGVFYLPITESDELLRTTYHFDDSKVLTPAVRSRLMASLCAAGSDLHKSCGWAVASLSARDIAAGMLRSSGGGGGAAYNLNAQAFDATVSLIRGVLARGVNVREIYVDTVGPPAAHQARLERVFPAARITVAKKADSLYACVSAASVCAKVTRDAALEVLYASARCRPRPRAAAVGLQRGEGEEGGEDGDDDDDDDGANKEEVEDEEPGWGSGYPSDARCVAWLRRNMHPVFGWGPECRFSWGTAKDMLETKGGVKVEWPVDEDDGTSRLTDFFVGSSNREKDADELGTWFGTPAGLEAF
ncbi:ribonuclease H2 subunit A [Xylariaceae sp. FL0662B]|nr:ribonuclease H2 subunit A [Xylariaceae sp. FL0662B]